MIILRICELFKTLVLVVAINLILGEINDTTTHFDTSTLSTIHEIQNNITFLQSNLNSKPEDDITTKITSEENTAAQSNDTTVSTLPSTYMELSSTSDITSVSATDTTSTILITEIVLQSNFNSKPEDDITTKITSEENTATQSDDTTVSTLSSTHMELSSTSDLTSVSTTDTTSTILIKEIDISTVPPVMATTTTMVQTIEDTTNLKKSSTKRSMVVIKLTTPDMKHTTTMTSFYLPQDMKTTIPSIIETEQNDPFETSTYQLSLPEDTSSSFIYISRNTNEDSNLLSSPDDIGIVPSSSSNEDRINIYLNIDNIDSKVDIEKNQAIALAVKPVRIEEPKSQETKNTSYSISSSIIALLAISLMVLLF